MKQLDPAAEKRCRELADVIERAMNRSPAETGTRIDIQPGDWQLIVGGLRLMPLLPLCDRIAEVLQLMGDYWAYGMAKAEGAQPTPEDDATVHQIATMARQAMDLYHAARGKIK